MRPLGPKDIVVGMIACYDKATFRRTANAVEINAKAKKAKVKSLLCPSSQTNDNVWHTKKRSFRWHFLPVANTLRLRHRIPPLEFGK